jgi:hypothetical protein
LKTFLAKHNAVEISHPPTPYSPDPAKRIFILFPTVKTALKGKKFQDAEDIKKNVTAELNAVPLESSADSFKKRFKICKNIFKLAITLNINKAIFLFP